MADCPAQGMRGLSRRDWLKAGAACGALCLAGGRIVRAGATGGAQKGLIGRRESPWFSEQRNGVLRCDLCPRHCRLSPGERGACRVRENRAGRGVSLVYGNPCLVQIDPIERKPFFHVSPGSQALSVSTAGCNMACKFCEVWNMALVAPEEVYAYPMPPETIVEQTRQAQVCAVSYAFGEPVIFYEYMVAIARAARDAGLLNIMHSNGYIAAKPLADLIPLLDAVNIDLKSFDPGFYREVCGGELDAVLESLQRLKAADVHLEITHLVIPSLNDDPAQVRSLCAWIARELGPDTPLHLARFYPLYQLANLPPTPVATLDAARAAAMEEGLRYVYVSRVTGHKGENTYCPRCEKELVRRLGFIVEENHVSDGRCGYCGVPIAGRWS